MIFAKYIYIYIYICTGCFKKRFAMVFQMLLCGECYENFYTLRRANCPSFSISNIVTFGIPL
jgi:hypothetical protein